MARRSVALIAVLLLVGGLAVAWGGGLLSVTCIDTVCANFSYAVNDKTVAFNATAQGGVTPYAFMWDFGDGAGIEKEDPVHTYTEYGTYTVILTVWDSSGGGGGGGGGEPRPLSGGPFTVTKEVVVSGPVGAELTASWTSDATLTTVKFSGSATGGAPPYLWAWDTDGDGQFDDYMIQNPTHDYGAYGSWIATLKVTDGNGAFAKHSKSVTLVPSPMSVDATIDSIDGFVAQFKSTITGGVAPYTYLWSFGDGASSPSANPAHDYAGAAPGVYTVTLRVTDADGAVVEAETSITVMDDGVQAEAEAEALVAPSFLLAVVLLLAGNGIIIAAVSRRQFALIVVGAGIVLLAVFILMGNISLPAGL